MTNTELKAQIDTQITNETVDNSVTPSEVGGNMKDTVDYTDQEVLVNKGLIDTNTSNIATNVTNIGLSTKNADTDVSTNGWVLDEDNMASDSATKVPTQQSVKAYVDANSGESVLEYSSTIQQIGINVFNSVSYDTISGGDFSIDPTDFRDLDYERTGVGTFTLKLRYTTATYPTDTSKLVIMFGDNSVRVVSRGSGGESGYNFYLWTFETYNTSGVIADDQLIGTQGASVNIKLYP